MKKNECYRGEVRSLRFPNKGIVIAEGEETPVLVKNTLPGQKITFRCKRLRRGRPEGLLLEVKEAKAPETGTGTGSAFPGLSGLPSEGLSFQSGYMGVQK